MPRRHNDQNSDEPPRKKSFTIPPDHNYVETGEVLTDISGNQWKIGKPIGLGGFGVIYEVICRNDCKQNNYVVKIEAHTSGPLFTEINCYLRIARQNMLDEWKKQKGLHSLGMPNYVASGSHTSKGDRYRFLVLPRYKKDLEMILQEKKKFNLKTVLLISSQVLEVLEYMHSKGYIHSDIKAANIMLDQLNLKKTKGCSLDEFSTYSKSPKSDSKSRYPKLRNCKARRLCEVKPKKRYDTRRVQNVNYNEDFLLSELSLLEEISAVTDETKNSSCKTVETNIEVDQLYLLDFGLASKFKLSTGEHKKNEDQRKAHAGTLLFCSRDAHKGMPSRRSDLESLAYNMVYWLTGSLPWIEDLENPEMMQRKKRHCFANPIGFLYFCMTDPPRILKDFFQYIKSLDVQDTPDYRSCQMFIKKALREHGYQDDGKFDFDNLEGWGMKKLPKMVEPLAIVPGSEFKRPPLLSNMPLKPLLRKKIKTKKAAAALNWSRMLSNPEVLLKRVRERRTIENQEPSPTFHEFNLEKLHPTPAMREVFQRYEERRGQSPNYQDTNTGDYPEGYTSAMVAVWQKMIEQQALEEAIKPVRKNRKAKKVPKRNVNNNCIKEPAKMRSKTVTLTRTYSLRG
ncbi:hypothetical protein HHI36_019033 [Cryptolaemus montrouzieri]|uniref:non-specific serine/threonine protein kinase n=1 Tax=Cryptolaemus montrouzieri TaxID=559131 RepID=A0ABD2P211_9CUCU